MTIKVFGEAKKEEPVLRLRLIDCGGDVLLAAVAERGAIEVAGRILTVSASGIQLHGSVSRHIGLPLDTEGKVKLC